ncbi:U6 small nuclear RNA (adenine-(43)-N(6))-methyltransferase isoform X2 [Trichogramma pretiosum]|uniref:U6 small nuclear RNA (adenine-(43)-N(6))-methyltransferase isoform X2 n=1 Tax=Trichogramma pretiosum TaxID=7493 RepID=UPI000C719828|nr:U6 small nuclear RNA (adenine-(43)-N(6))-methyltransferase isoform X2 [Trichogramma pretiosum]
MDKQRKTRKEYSRYTLNRFMHPRNRYRVPPNFKELCEKNWEFKKCVSLKLNGKLTIDFNNKYHLRMLTQALLKHDFDLQVTIPRNNLIPTLPLRLNYILWIEDLLRHAGIRELHNVTGIDIGTGPIGIYPLLIQRMFKSSMVCTDINPDSIESAKKNIIQNGLETKIKVFCVDKDSILGEVMQQNYYEYAFTMCNPPFFEDKPEKRDRCDEKFVSGHDHEVRVTGGEEEFIRQLMDESLMYKTKIKIYTTMFGKKKTLKFIREQLKQRNITNFVWTEFCQGYTKRWGIAWSFIPKNMINFTTAPRIQVKEENLKIKKDLPKKICFPSLPNLSCKEETMVRLKKIFSQLNIMVKDLPSKRSSTDQDYLACKCIANSESWTGSRRKRRMAMRKEAMKRVRLENTENSEQIDCEQPDSLSISGLTENQQGPMSIFGGPENEQTENIEPYLVFKIFVTQKVAKLVDDGSGKSNNFKDSSHSEDCFDDVDFSDSEGFSDSKDCSISKDCSDSKDCRDFEGSNGSEDCSDSEGSSGSEDCSDSEGRSDSKDCSISKDCSDSKDFRDFEGSNGSEDCSDSEGSSGSEDCSDSEGSSGSEDSSDSEESDDSDGSNDSKDSDLSHLKGTSKSNKRKLQNQSQSQSQKLIIIYIMYEESRGGKQGIETLRQYLVNTLNVRQYFMLQSANDSLTAKIHKEMKQKRERIKKEKLTAKMLRLQQSRDRNF